MQLHLQRTGSRLLCSALYNIFCLNWVVFCCQKNHCCNIQASRSLVSAFFSERVRVVLRFCKTLFFPQTLGEENVLVSVPRRVEELPEPGPWNRIKHPSDLSDPAHCGDAWGWPGGGC